MTRLATPPPPTIAPAAAPPRIHKLLPGITLLYVTLQLACDVTAGKLVWLFGFSVSATALYFPLTYLIADVLTEVYGYAAARRAMWQVLLCSVIATLVYQVALWMPPAPGFDADPAYRRVLAQVPRVVLGSWVAIFAGDIANNYVLARMKVATRGRWLWMRTIGSTFVGQLVNTALFYTIALSGVIPRDLLIASVVSGWLLKTLVEAVMTPVTYAVVGWVKRTEGVDHYDVATDFSPLKY